MLSACLLKRSLKNGGIFTRNNTVNFKIMNNPGWLITCKIQRRYCIRSSGKLALLEKTCLYFKRFGQNENLPVRFSNEDKRKKF